VHEQITGVILAGGLARRMGGVDKGLMHVGERPLIEYVIDALAPQVATLLINANRHQPRYRHYGYPVIGDTHEGFCGPLAGILSALEHATAPWVLSAPCDAPLLPADYGARLWQAMERMDSQAAVVHDGGRIQPVFALLATSLADRLRTYLESGQRRTDTWLLQQSPAIVDMADCSEAFINLNEPADIRDFENRLAQRAS
jgi:molybdenum cofactor guanylyltransferase